MRYDSNDSPASGNTHSFTDVKNQTNSVNSFEKDVEKLSAEGIVRIFDESVAFSTTLNPRLHENEFLNAMYLLNQIISRGHYYKTKFASAYRFHKNQEAK